MHRSAGAFHKHKVRGGVQEESHACFRRGITRIRLAGPDIGLDVLRRHQLHAVPELGNLTGPIMRTAAGLHADQTRRQLGEERRHLLASEPSGDDDLALGIDAVDLEHLL